jgi:glycosyltransferase involved in cell wall biosynthesis
MKNLPLVSVLIPSYNSNNTIRIAINSIKRQSYKNLEIVIVDDGSKPRVPNFNLDPQFSRLKLKIVKSKKNIGISKSLNIGLDHCNGKIIARLDADDEMLKDRISNQVDAILKYDLDLVYSQMLVDGKKNIYCYPVSQKALKICMLYGNAIPHPAIAIKAELLRKYKYKDLNVKGLEDYFLWARIIRSGAKVQGLETYDVNYKTSSKQLSKKKTNFNFRYKNSICYIENLFNSQNYNLENKYSVITILRILKILKGTDLRAFQIIAASNIKRNILQKRSIVEKFKLFLSFVIIKLYK